MRVAPEYRLRLFLSVDLVGSTAFKAQYAEPSGAESPDPAWVDKVKRFYREFPRLLRTQFKKISSTHEDCPWDARYPLVWKTIGDEIVFCCKLDDLTHLCCCISAFIETLKGYGEDLEKSGLKLDVKGYGWLAAFPSPNVTVDIYSDTDGDLAEQPQDIPTEDLETKADQTPQHFDFLGKNIDAGFRIGRLCAPDEFTLSIELAYLLSLASKDKVTSSFTYLYSGRQTLKGVLNDRPYPVVALDVGRSHKRSLIRQRERQLHGNGAEPTALGIHDFLHEFFEDEAIDLPSLSHSKKKIPIPESYTSYLAAWNGANEEILQRGKQEQAAAMQPEHDGTEAVPELVVRWSDEFIAAQAEIPARRRRRRRRNGHLRPDNPAPLE